VTVAPGESVDVELQLPASACTIVDADGKRIVEPGEFDLLVGHSSRDRDLLRSRFSIIG
jgi:beta-glucosidase